MTGESLKVDLTGKTAIVTGASRGIGKAISLALAQAGASVVLAARTERESPEVVGTIYKTAEEIKKLGGRALPIRCDVTIVDEVQNMVDKALSTYGAIDILVNNAAIVFSPQCDRFLGTEIEEYNNTLQVNILGSFICTRTVLAHMLPRKSGSIVNISSGASESTNPEGNAYSTSKAALNRMMIKLATEIAEHNIAVNILYPGHTQLERPIDRIPSGQVGRSLAPPSAVGPPAVWLAAQNATTFTGRIVKVSAFGSEWP